mmetsp:Transcript_89331/g.248090  ORF Transcript_89331/g.248090 Transcript_89331/m.248090 type:complete len:227 (+) Transcript_89331:397-1077(+)
MAARPSAATCRATSSSVVGPSQRFGRESCQPRARRSSRSFRRHLARGLHEAFCAIALTCWKQAFNILQYCQSGVSKVGPTTVKSTASDSNASGVVWASNSWMIANMTLQASIFLVRRAPTKRMFPIMRVLYWNSKSVRSSCSASWNSAGGAKFRSKDAWHSFSSSRLKLNLLSSLTGLFSKCSCSSAQRSAYMSTKWCCVVAFSKTSRIRASAWPAVLMPLSTSFV